jgi:plastocyanin
MNGAGEDLQNAASRRGAAIDYEGRHGTGRAMSLHGRSMIAACVLLAPVLDAAELDVRISTVKGAPVADAVVSVIPRNETAGVRDAAPATKIIDQKDETFIPYVEIFRPGDSVVFRNSDQTRHHVYSFAPARQFEFVLTSGQSSPPLRLEHAGVVAVGCNIHDRMITYLYIGEAPWMTRSGADGRAAIDTLPVGDYDVQVWHPQLRPGQAVPNQTAHVVDGGSAELSFTLSLLPDPRVTADRERVEY